MSPKRRRELAREQHELSRREFFRAASCAAITTASLVSTVWDLRMVNAAARSSFSTRSSPSYRAMVCIFMDGGNDANNMIIPIDARYTDYTTARGSLAIPQASIRPLDTTFTTPLQYGIHPSMGGVDALNQPNRGVELLFKEGKVAVVTNVGTLAYPINKTQYINKTVPRPLQLLSHEDQVKQWQTSVADKPSRTGWGGHCADLLDSLNDPNANVSMLMSLYGSNTFEIGADVNQFNVSTSGGVSLTRIDAVRKQALRDILDMPTSNLHQASFSTITDRAIQGADDINNAIALTREPTDTPAGTWVWNSAFPNTTLGRQLKMIARLIHAQGNSLLNQSRQIFFARIGGYDTHGGQVAQGSTTAGQHANLLGELSNCMFAFQRALEQISKDNNVVTFTISDFSRTLKNNNSDPVPNPDAGSEHAWASHHFVMGGTNTVNGKKFYGDFPSLQFNGPDDIDGNGRWIPTVSVDQYAATLARWFGVDEAMLPVVFPNLGRFASSDVGFMNNAAPLAAPTPLKAVREPLVP